MINISARFDTTRRADFSIKEDFRAYNDRDLFYAGKVLSTYALQSGSDYDKMKKTVMNCSESPRAEAL